MKLDGYMSEKEKKSIKNKREIEMYLLNKKKIVLKLHKR